ncbi:nucleotide-binding universal stress UspA family protein [Solirubrobacter pauli]|uniref:Nucleotide-binding universal stress UspA family protein n=1 Tax=Solirubrobacter pauli TaxID=166793 RepID=A0A660L5H0_9ACTN|nr:universal stress protein [Solirubrobacter pauli]RKQ87163.1 nucleotide-binding universal stress UspA family protein [Solirubrobacter pauli]
MTRLLIAYDGSPSAKAAIAFAGSLFDGASAVVAHVHPPPPSDEAGALARVALSDAMLSEGLKRMRADAEAAGRRTVDEGVAIAGVAGLPAESELRFALTPWRELRALAEEVDADVLVAGTHGPHPVERMILGSTASSLVHHAERPLLVVPGDSDPSGPIVVGYDGSDHARSALAFAARHLPGRELLVAHAWAVPTLVGAPSLPLSELADEGAAIAREAGQEASALTVDGTGGQWRALLAAAVEQDAAAIVVGSRGRGAVASTVLGSVASGLVHAAARPVLVVP